jgi:hypothetical protein
MIDWSDFYVHSIDKVNIDTISMQKSIENYTTHH